MYCSLFFIKILNFCYHRPQGRGVTSSRPGNGGATEDAHGVKANVGEVSMLEVGVLTSSFPACDFLLFDVVFCY